MFHEVAHGWTALRYGDDTAQKAGRLSFNPLDHVDPIGSLLLPLICLLTHMPLLGWAKPVPVNPHRLRDPRAAMVKVALVGPLSNIVLAVAAALLLRLAAGLPSLSPSFHLTIMRALGYAIIINLFLAYFNLLPIYPLDGSKVLSGLLPFRYRLTYEKHAPYGFMIILGLIYLGVIRVLVITPAYLTLALLARVGLL